MCVRSRSLAATSCSIGVNRKKLSRFTSVMLSGAPRGTAFCSWIAVVSPANPPPRITTRTGGRTVTRRARRGWSELRGGWPRPGRPGRAAVLRPPTTPGRDSRAVDAAPRRRRSRRRVRARLHAGARAAARGTAGARCAWPRPCRRARSEEHTSELQSPCNLVCRLLLEKKKKKNILIQQALANQIQSIVQCDDRKLCLPDSPHTQPEPGSSLGDN